MFRRFNDLISGADGIRTHDLRIANATLSQLSYGPISLLKRYAVTRLESIGLPRFFLGWAMTAVYLARRRLKSHPASNARIFPVPSRRSLYPNPFD